MWEDEYDEFLLWIPACWFADYSFLSTFMEDISSFNTSLRFFSVGFHIWVFVLAVSHNHQKQAV